MPESRLLAARATYGSALVGALCCALSASVLPSDASARERVAQTPYSVRLLAAINAHRVRHGEAQLISASDLDRLAHEHSRNMATAGRLSHEGFRDRVMRADSAACVENVGWNYASPDAQLRAWSESPAHHKNLLDPKVTRAGVGDSNAYVTFIACR